MTRPKNSAQIVALIAPPENTQLESTPVVRVMNRAAFLTFTQNGVAKRVQTTRAGLEYIQAQISKALDCPVSNVNGVETGYYAD